MTLREIAALIRRNLLATVVVLMLAASTGYDIRSSAPTYTASATVVFTATKSLATAFYATGAFRSPLIVTEVMMAQDLGDRGVQKQVRDLGGTAKFELVPFNVYDLEYPDYAEPFGTLTTTSTSPASAGRTLTIVLRYLAERLAAIQAQVGVHARNRIQTYLAGRTPPTAQKGSRPRVFAGLLLLTVIAVFLVSNFLDRRRRSRAERRPRAIELLPQVGRERV